jgi:hypothetical protein
LAFIRIERLSVAFLQAFDANPLCRLLRHLMVAERDYDAEGFDEREDLAALVRSPHLGNLRQFQLGPSDDPSQTHVPGAEAVDMVKKMPKVEELRLYAHRVGTDRLFQMPFPHLRVLEVHHLHKYPLEVLAANATLKNLEYLSFWPHGLEHVDQPYITLEGARAIIRSPSLPKLRVLVMRNSDLGDEGCEEIVSSGMLKRLKVLNLRGGRITDAGAQTLAGSRHLKNLELLDVSNNVLTEAGLAALRATGGPRGVGTPARRNGPE